MHRLCALLCLMASTAPLCAETISSEIGSTGLAAVEARLAALAAPTDEEKFALGGVRFLGAVEGAMQKRWTSGMTDTTGMLPFLRTPIPENPTPGPPDPALIAAVFTEAATAMDAARAPLAAIPETSDFGMELALADVWFDINTNAARDVGEGLVDVLGPMLMGWEWETRDPATPAPVIRFDVADAVWLSAYTHMLGGVSEMVLAYDPTAALTQTITATAALQALDPTYKDADAYNITAAINLIATLDLALRQTPDADRMASAKAHFLTMVAENRHFWALVESETDNVREWLPNDRQKSAIGVDLPQGAGKAWLAILGDAEDLLNGTKLLPFWSVGTAAGVNVERLFSDPRAIDLVGWIQGWAALPYLENGDVVSGASWAAFAGMILGDAMVVSLYLN